MKSDDAFDEEAAGAKPRGAGLWSRGTRLSDDAHGQCAVALVVVDRD